MRNGATLFMVPGAFFVSLAEATCVLCRFGVKAEHQYVSLVSIAKVKLAVPLAELMTPVTVASGSGSVWIVAALTQGPRGRWILS
jgi:hypothetical protein